MIISEILKKQLRDPNMIYMTIFSYIPLGDSPKPRIYRADYLIVQIIPLSAAFPNQLGYLRSTPLVNSHFDPGNT